MNLTNKLISLQVWANEREEFIPTTDDEWTALFADWCMNLFVLRNGEMVEVEIDDWTMGDYNNTFFVINDGLDSE